MRKLGAIWAITCLNAGVSSLHCEIYEVSNGNSDICGHPRPMMEGECLIQTIGRVDYGDHPIFASFHSGSYYSNRCSLPDI